MRYWQYLVAFSAISLSACSSNTVKDTLGLSRSAPDEFRVVSRPPLSVPPQFTLRPPANSDASPNELTSTQKAQSLVLGGKAADSTQTTGTADTSVTPVTIVNTPNRKATTAPVTSAESQFLKDAGADKSDPKVRDTLVEERYTAQDKKDDSSWWDIFSSSSEKKDTLVDAKKESDRIKKNEDEGQPVTTGDTPEVKASDTGLLGRIFGY